MPLRTYCEAAYQSRASYGCLQHRYVVCQVSLKHTVPNSTDSVQTILTCLLPCHYSYILALYGSYEAH